MGFQGWLNRGGVGGLGGEGTAYADCEVGGVGAGFGGDFDGGVGGGEEGFVAG